MIFWAKPVSAKKPPENTSWKISRKGMTVMAVVVVRTSEEIISASMSEA